ncbi:MAG: UDP-N-acetylmuramate dehydrogenase [Patescibacteria group bacterium]|nr:UDP-N-acetylmuramate dehydrogenase [Patescibacteria group bacterium]MDD5715096.1 UDP-N-acetylmuramate dehydrogenase [Patescibacteria group bacterium]
MKQAGDSSTIHLLGVEQDVVLAPFTNFKIGGPAAYFIRAKSNEEIIAAIQEAIRLNIDYVLLGKGTNVLVSDGGFRGLVIKVENSGIYQNGNVIRVESGVLLQQFIQFCVSKNLSGMEFLTGIPGTIGGAIVGNVGTPTEWISKIVESIILFSKENGIESLAPASCNFSYRGSIFKNSNTHVVLGGTFHLAPAAPEAIQNLSTKYAKLRAHQPGNYPCAGSVFKNPDGLKAWELIEKAGLRGKMIGGAQVSEKHANFIINAGNARAEDVVTLISYIKQQVRDTSGIQLQEEIVYIGF